MKNLMVVVSLLLLLGCAQSGSRNNYSSQASKEVNPSAKIHTELAGLYYERSQLGIALSETDLALRADNGYAPAYNVRGLIRMTLREYREAEEDFRRSLQLDNTDSQTHNNYGWFLCQRERAAESIPHFMAALKNPLYTTPERAYLNAGLCSVKAGNQADAEDFLQRALIVSREMPAALLALAELNFSRGNYQTAKDFFTRFSNRVNSLNAEQLGLAVNIEKKTGNRNAEASYAMQLRKRFPDSPEAKQLMSGE